MHEATQNIYDNFIVYVAVCLFIQSAVSQNLYQGQTRFIDSLDVHIRRCDSLIVHVSTKHL